MTAAERVKEKVEGLLAEGKEVLDRAGWDGNRFMDDLPSDNDYVRFRTESLNIIRRACGEESDHYREMTRLAQHEYSQFSSHYFPQCYAVLEAAYRDFSGGFLFDLRALVQADILGDFLEQAETLLDGGYHVPAASLAGAVLEDTLRKMCDRRGVTYPERTNIDSLNAELARDGAYNRLIQKEITAKADIRNNADHAKFDQFGKEDVAEMVKWVRRFASEHLK